MIELVLMTQFLGQYRNERVRLFRRNVIDKTVQDIRTGRIHQVKAAIKGQADVYGFVKQDAAAPTPIEIEFKGHKTAVSQEQLQWRAFCNLWKIPHLELRAGKDEEAFTTIRRWTTELNELCILL